MMTRIKINRCQTIAALAVCLLCLALKSAQSASPGKEKGQQQDQTKSSPVTLRETQPAAPAAPALSQSKHVSPPGENDNGSSKTPKVANSKLIKPTQDGLANRFQARMMGSDLTSSANSRDNSDSPISIDGSQNSDIWQPNGSLAPTFTDQEQGDEMVALASDAVDSEQVATAAALPPPPPQPKLAINRSRSGATNHHLSGDNDQDFVERPPSRGRPVVDNRQTKLLSDSGRQTAAIDEYYNDEEDDDDEVPSKASEFEPIEPKERVASSSRYRSSHHQSDQFGDYQVSGPLPFDESSNYRDQTPDDQVAANKSSVNNKLAQFSGSQVDGSWQPKVNSAQASYTPEDSSNSGQQRVQEGNNNKQQHSATAKRLATLLSGGKDSLGAFSRADVAIEYLRNMLKNKQQQQKQQGSSSGNYSSSELSNPKQQFDSSITDKNIGLQRLSSLASKLNQIFNSTTSAKSSYNETASTKTEHQSHLSNLDTKKPTNFEGDITSAHLDLIEPKTFLSQQADTKFSIVDAKPLPGLKYQADSTPLPTTKLPNQLAGENGAGPDARLYTSSQYSKDPSLFLNGSPNGTPLGGDYIESQDDFPRGATSRLPYQNPLSPPTLMGSESQQAPVKSYQPSEFPEQSAIVQATPPNLRRPPQESGPVSSSYFQMHQLPSAGHLRNQPAPSDAQRISAQNTLPIQQQPFKPIASHGSFKPEQVVNQTSRKDYKQDEQKRQFAAFQLDRSPVQQQQQQRYPQQQTSKSDHQTSDQAPLSSSKLYKIANEQASLPLLPTQQQQQQQQPPIGRPNLAAFEQERKQQLSSTNNAALLTQKQMKPPKIVSYNYFESPNEPGQSEYTETNYQLGDALYSSNGGMEHLLSGAELEAIQNQFMTLEHPVVPIGSAEQQINAQIHQQQQQHQSQQHHQQQNYQAPDSGLAQLLAGLKDGPSFITPESLQKLSSPEKQAEEVLKELASHEQPISVLAPPHHLPPPQPPTFGQVSFERSQAPQKNPQFEGESGRGHPSGGKIPNSEQADLRKKKSLIVYLNHPRPVDMSKRGLPSSNDGHNLAQSIGDQPNESSFVSAKEFDSHGLSKDTKHLDVSNLHGLGEIKEGQDKDGLSVVVIGDAYKYKKIVLLISSKSGGLKFIPMVKDMKR